MDMPNHRGGGRGGGQCEQCLLQKHEDLNYNLQNACKKPGVLVCAGWRRNFWDMLAVSLVPGSMRDHVSRE